jgi:uridine kinase
MQPPGPVVEGGRAVAVEALLARARPAGGGRSQVVAVDGPSGSGKTTLGRRLAAAAGRAALVHMDDLYPGWDGLEDAVPRLVGQVLEPLAAGRPARWRRWDWAAHRYAAEVEVQPAPVVVVEGVGSGARACAPHLSLLVWIEAPPALRLERGLARDGEAYRPHWERWARQEQAHFAREGTRERADVRLDGAV